MTTQLTKEQIKRIGAMYWGCEIVTKYGAKHTVNTAFTVLIFDFGGKLLLTPLSAISDEDAIEVAKMYGYDFSKKSLTATEILKTTRDSVQHLGYPSAGFGIGYIWIYQCLIQKGYAVPLFLEPNHPLNGKTAIKLGLAIDKTKEATHA